MPSQINVDTVAPYLSSSVDVSGVTVSGVNATASMRLGSVGTQVQGNANTIIGRNASNSVTADNNTVVGSSAATFLTTGQRNTVVGQKSGYYLSSGANNVFVGDQAGLNTTTGADNVAIGPSAAFFLTTGSNNVFIGTNAGQGVGNITGFGNVAIGAGATISTAGAIGEFTLGSLGIYTLRCAVTSITSLSDARDKKDITDLRVGLDFVKSLRPVEFVWDDRREEGRHDVADFGFIAQDLKAAQEDVDMADTLKLVYESNPERLEASYGKLVPVLVQAIKDLAAKVEVLEKKK